jgi:hypothetical protein
MITPSSTSQSALLWSRGSITSSFGPVRQEIALVKKIGSGGGSSPDSRAWSA